MPDLNAKLVACPSQSCFLLIPFADLSHRVLSRSCTLYYSYLVSTCSRTAFPRTCVSSGSYCSDIVAYCVSCARSYGANEQLTALPHPARPLRFYRLQGSVVTTCAVLSDVEPCSGCPPPRARIARRMRRSSGIVTRVVSNATSDFLSSQLNSTHLPRSYRVFTLLSYFTINVSQCCSYGVDVLPLTCNSTLHGLFWSCTYAWCLRTRTTERFL